MDISATMTISAGPCRVNCRDALDQSLREMNGSGVWRSPKSRGVGTNPYEALFVAKDEPMRRWRNRTLELLKRHLEPHPSSRAREDAPHEYVLPVLSPRDRRAFVRSLWTPFIPEAAWSATLPKRTGDANVYLDVSGSMNAEMPQIIALLGRLSRYIRRPFWAFSDCVAPAVIKDGKLVASTTGGTSMACVLEHVAETRPPSAIVVTDGYIERLRPSLVKKAAGVRLHALEPRPLLHSGCAAHLLDLAAQPAVSPNRYRNQKSSKACANTAGVLSACGRGVIATR